MINPQAAVFSRITGDATLVALLATFGGAAAVFEDGKVPGDDAFQIGATPYIVITPPAHQSDDDTLDADYRNEQMNVRLYHSPNGSSSPLQTAAERVRTLFKDWGPAAITGGTLVNCTVLGPSPAPTEDPSIDGRIVQLSLLIKES